MAWFARQQRTTETWVWNEITGDFQQPHSGQEVHRVCRMPTETLEAQRERAKNTVKMTVRGAEGSESHSGPHPGYSAPVSKHRRKAGERLHASTAPSLGASGAISDVTGSLTDNTVLSTLPGESRTDHGTQVLPFRDRRLGEDRQGCGLSRTRRPSCPSASHLLNGDGG